MSAARLPRLLTRPGAIGAAAVLIGVIGINAGTAAASGKRPGTSASGWHAPSAASHKKPSKSSSASKPAVSTPAFYTLKNPSAKCRLHYTKQRITITVHKHHRTVRTHQTRCVYTGGSSANGATVSFPTDLPTAGITVNVIPSADDASYSVAADETLSVGGDGVLTGEHDGGLTAAVVTTTKHGALTLKGDGTFRYTPDTGFSGDDSFTYRTVSSAGESSVPATVTIHVTPVAIGVGAYAVPLAGTLSVDAPGVLTGDIGSGLQAKLVSGPSGGTLTLNADGSFSYTARPSFSGADSFSFEAVDSSGQDSGTIAVTINVGAQPPVVYSQTFAGAIGNTELAVGGSPGSGPEVYLNGQSALNADIDPGGGTLTTSPGTISTSQGGTVTMTSDGSFTYQPPVGFDGPTDTFDYTVDSSEGASAQATATISFDTTRVWYVNSAAPGGGNGSSVAPFDSLAGVEAGGVTAAGDVIFIYGSGTDYTGGLTLTTDQTLDGQSQGLTVDSEQLLAASGSNPVITNGAGAGLTLADGDVVDGVSVADATGDGVSVAAGASVRLEGGVGISNAGGDGIDAVGAAALTVQGATITASAGNGIDASGAGAVAVNASTISGTGAAGILVDNSSSLTSDSFNIINNTIDGARGTAISIAYAGYASGFIDGNSIGAAGTADSGSATGDGISVTSSSNVNGPLLAEVSENTIEQIGTGTGIDVQTSGPGSLALTLTHNAVAMASAASQNGVTVASGADGDGGTLCMNASDNTVTAAGTGSATYGIEAEQVGSASTFAIENYNGGPTDTTAVASFLTSLNPALAGAGGGSPADAVLGGTNPGFTEATCLTPAYNI
ncbi:MAG: Ig-like domain-containing protein [Solirubrobacteraceae bacterium]